MIMVLVLGSRKRFLDMVSGERRRGVSNKYTHYDNENPPKLVGLSFDDVVFLKYWDAYYDNVLDVLNTIFPYLRGPNLNKETVYRIEFLLEVFSKEREDLNAEDVLIASSFLKSKEKQNQNNENLEEMPIAKRLGLMIRRIYKALLLVVCAIFILSLLVGLIQGIFFKDSYALKFYIERVLDYSMVGYIFLGLVGAANYLKDEFGSLVEWVRKG
jgi:hypothetical protein